MMPFSYQKVLIIGATSGIGKMLAEKVVQNGSKLIAVGRRKENLEDLVQQHGRDKVSVKTFDIMQLEQVRSSAPGRCRTNNEQIQDPSVRPRNNIRKSRSGLHLRQFRYPAAVRFRKAGNRRSRDFRPGIDHELYISCPPSQGISPTSSGLEHSNSYFIHNIPNGARAYDALPQLWRI